MALLSKSGIGTGNTIQSSHITNIYDALNGSGSYEIVATGSFSGSFVGTITSASFASTASYIVTAQTASYVLSSVSASRSTSSSFATLAATATTASYIVTAQTASYVLNSVSASFATSASRATSASFSTSSSISVSASFAISASHVTNFAASIQTTGSTLYSVNPAAGLFADQSDIGTVHNIILGEDAGSQTYTTSKLIAIGRLSGYASSGSNNSVFIGDDAGSQGISPYAVSIGSSAGGSGDLPYSVAIGYNSAINVSGEKVVAIGYQAGANATTNNSILLGPEAGLGLVGNNNIIIGNNVSLPNGTTNAINIGGVLFGSNTWNNSGFNQLTGSQSTGRIGIAKVNPSATLDVSGSVLVTGSLNVSTGITGSLFGTASFATSSSRAVSASFATDSSTTSMYSGYNGVTYSPTITTVGSKQYYPVALSLPSVGNVIDGGTNTRSSISFKVTVSATHVVSNAPSAGGSFKRQQISYDAIAYNDIDSTLVISYASSSIGDSIATCGLEQGDTSNQVKFWVAGALTADQNNAHVSIQYTNPISASAFINGIG